MTSGPIPEEVDTRLLMAAAAGDVRAFGTFVGRHQASLLRFGRAMGLRTQDAEDTLQETFLSAWKNAGQFRGCGSARSWLFSIARRLVYRKTKRCPAPEREMLSLEELGALAGWGKSASQDWLDDRLSIQQAIERLAPHQRIVLVLRDLEGLSNAQAASVLDLSIAAVKGRLHRARLQLAAYLRPEDHR